MNSAPKLPIPINNNFICYLLYFYETYCSRHGWCFWLTHHQVFSRNQPPSWNKFYQKTLVILKRPKEFYEQYFPIRDFCLKRIFRNLPVFDDAIETVKMCKTITKYSLFQRLEFPNSLSEKLEWLEVFHYIGWKHARFCGLWYMIKSWLFDRWPWKNLVNLKERSIVRCLQLPYQKVINVFILGKWLSPTSRRSLVDLYILSLILKFMELSLTSNHTKAARLATNALFFISGLSFFKLEASRILDVRRN